MKAVWKYPVPAANTFTVEMPKDAKVLSMQVYEGTPQMWALVDPDAPRISRRFFITETNINHIIYDDDHFIGTFFMMGGSLALHLFERTRGIEEPTS